MLVFASNAHGITGVDPETGATLWEVRGVLPERVVSSPVVAGDMIFATSGEGGRGKHLVAVRPVREGGNWRAEVVYTLDDSKVLPYVPTLIARGKWLFGFQDGGTVSCLELATGRVLWSEKPAGRFFGSPVCVDGVLYAMTTKGDVVVVRADASYELLGVNALGEKSHATPTVGAGRVVFRTESHVYAIGNKGR
jgi:outer membrane protein assembly factor BamB